MESSKFMCGIGSSATELGQEHVFIGAGKQGGRKAGGVKIPDLLQSSTFRLFEGLRQSQIRNQTKQGEILDHLLKGLRRHTDGWCEGPVMKRCR